MKRIGNLWPSVIERGNLAGAFHQAARGKRRKLEVRRFAADLDGNLERLRRELGGVCTTGILPVAQGKTLARCQWHTPEGPHQAGRTFEIGKFNVFKVHDPKERTIHAARFPERVFHHALMNLCEPVLERQAVFHSYACRKGKGQVAAGERARHYARRYPWFLKMDVRKYFDSIPHAKLLELLVRLFKDAGVLRLFENIVGSYETRPGHGLPIGSLTSQYFANHFLTGLDRFARETLQAPGYVRYMDDFALWHPDKGFLKAARDRITAWLGEERGLVVKHEPQVNRTANGMDFLGLRILPGTVRLNHRSKIRFLRRLRGLEAMESAGIISEAELQCRATCLVAFTLRADTLAFRRDALFPQETTPDGGQTASTALSVAAVGTTT